MNSTGTAIVESRSQRFMAELDEYTPNLADALPAHISVERFKRVLITAISSNPDLLNANRRTLFTAAVKCAADGLIPDGREAALVVYRTKAKVRGEDGLDREEWVDAVQLMPMIAGIRKRMRNSGEVLSAVAEAVFAKDSFRYSRGDNPHIEHEPPPIGQDRGEVVGAYAIIHLANGEVIRDVIGKKEIEAARAVSRSKDSPMWKNFYWEAAKKVVMRRASKQAPLSAELERLLQRDDEDPARLAMPGGFGSIIGAEDHPHALPNGDGKAIEHTAAAEPEKDAAPQFAIVDLDGVEHVFDTPGRAVEAVSGVLAEAEKRGEAALAGAWESNQPLLQALEVHGKPEAVNALAVDFSDAQERLSAKARAAEAAAEQPKDHPGASSRGDNGASLQAEKLPLARTGGATPPTGADEPAGRPASVTIAPVLRNGKPDWKTWAKALVIPKLRRITDAVDLAYFLGDNEENLAQALRALDAADRVELEAAIAKQREIAT